MYQHTADDEMFGRAADSPLLGCSPLIDSFRRIYLTEIADMIGENAAETKHGFKP